MTVMALPSEERFVLYDLDWEFYESLLARLDNRPVFVTYDHGTLELMSPSQKHDKSSRLICRMIWVLAEEMNLPISSAGSTTLKRQDLRVALEADECFYIQNESRVRGKDEIELPADPPPDLAVEVEITQRLKGRLSIYAELGVPELWRYRDGTLSIHVLRADGAYEQAARSPTFPQAPLDELARFVEAGRMQNETEWIKVFRAWVRRLRA